MGNWLILPFLLLLCFLTGNVLQYITKEEKENRHLHPVLLGAVFWMCCAGSSVFLQNFTMVYRLFACLVLAVMGLGVLFLCCLPIAGLPQGSLYGKRKAESRLFFCSLHFWQSVLPII